MSHPEFDFNLLSEEQQLAVTAQTLQSLEPGFLPRAIYDAMSPLAVRATVEVGFVQPSEYSDDGAKIILTQRPLTADEWPGQWHVPGTTLRPDDPVKHEHDYRTPIKRVLAEVGGDVQILGKPVEYDHVLRAGKRGHEITTRFIAEVAGEPERGKFFYASSVLRRPPQEGLVETHDAAIRRIAAKYAILRAGR